MPTRGGAAEAAPPISSPPHPRITEVFDVLDRSAVPWVLLRGQDELARPSGDVDILVSPQLVPRLDGMLASVGFSRMLSPGRGTHRFYFSYDVDTALWLKLDIVSDLAFGPYQQWRSSLAVGCLQRRSRNEAPPRPAAPDQAWLHLLHLLLDRGNITGRRLSLARSLVDEASPHGAIASFLEQVAGAGAARRILAAAHSGQIKEVHKVVAGLRAAWTRTAPIGTRCRRVANRARRVVHPPTVQGSAHTGLSVAVMGPERVGATSLLQGLSEGFPVPSKRVSMNGWVVGRHDPVLRTVSSRWSLARLSGFLRRRVVSYHLARGRLVLLHQVAYEAGMLTSRSSSIADPLSSLPARRSDLRTGVLIALEGPDQVRPGAGEDRDGWTPTDADGVFLLDATLPPAELQSRATRLVWDRFVAQAEPQVRW